MDRLSDAGSIPAASTTRQRFGVHPERCFFISVIIAEGVFSMASSSSYLAYILDQLSGIDGISHRAMMGEYILYLNGKVIGGIYDDRFLVKQTKTALQLMPDAPRELPYPGAKEMLLVTDPDDRQLLSALLTAVYQELPNPKK